MAAYPHSDENPAAWPHSDEYPAAYPRSDAVAAARHSSLCPQALACSSSQRPIRSDFVDASVEWRAASTHQRTGGRDGLSGFTSFAGVESGGFTSFPGVESGGVTSSVDRELARSVPSQLFSIGTCSFEHQSGATGDRGGGGSAAGVGVPLHACFGGRGRSGESDSAPECDLLRPPDNSLRVLAGRLECKSPTTVPMAVATAPTIAAIAVIVAMLSLVIEAICATTAPQPQISYLTEPAGQEKIQALSRYIQNERR